MTLAYRADIDGLRAVAVLSVALFHAHIPPFSGGFVGVDVFFVISGYLITAILQREIAAGDFSLLSFYDRRIRRIFPALLIVLATCLGIGAWILLPLELNALAQQTLWATFFTANIYFNSNLSYFGIHADAAPLLNLWSLAVEEQFYIVFPLLMLGLARLNAAWLRTALLLGLAAASLVHAQLLLQHDPQSAFYLLPARAWELLLGSLLAVLPLPALGSRAARVAGISGALLICLPVVVYTKAVAFPGLAALPPCLGAALLIHAGRQANASPVHRFLSLPPTVYLGRISYALYLWHWPLLVLAHLYKDRDLTRLQSLAVIAVSIALSALSLQYVETPIRRMGASLGRRWATVAAGIVAMLLMAGTAQLLVLQQGRLWPLSAKAVAADAARQDFSSFQVACDTRFTGAVVFTPTKTCSFGPEAGTDRRDVVVWGDSHAGALFIGIAEQAAALGLTTRLQMLAGCPPLIGGRANYPLDPRIDRDCGPFNAAVMADIERAPPRLVVLVARWAMWTTHGETGVVLTTQEQPERSALTRANSRAVFPYMLERTVQQIRATGARVLLVGQVPEYVVPPPHCVMQAEYLGGDSARCLTDEKTLRARGVAWSDNMLGDAAAKIPGTFAVALSGILCPETQCISGTGDTYYYLDADHLSQTGARFATGRPPFRTILEEALRP